MFTTGHVRLQKLKRLFRGNPSTPSKDSQYSSPGTMVLSTVHRTGLGLTCGSVSVCTCYPPCELSRVSKHITDAKSKRFWRKILKPFLIEKGCRDHVADVVFGDVAELFSLKKFRDIIPCDTFSFRTLNTKRTTKKVK